MTASRSTPRLRLTQGLYAIVLVLVAASGGRTLAGTAGLAAQGAGFALVVAGTLWRVWASAFIAGRKDVELVCEGPYARCRHPLYLGSLLTALGIGLSTRSVVLALALPVVLFALLAASMRGEDDLLARRHGAAWLDYRSRVRALWPRAGRIPAPPPRLVDPAVYFKAFLDAASMLGLWLLVVALDALRMQGAWPSPWVLP